jgi:hypothetical protein
MLTSQSHCERAMLIRLALENRDAFEAPDGRIAEPCSALFVSQGHDRIDFRCAASWEIASQQSDDA